ncbi:MAG: GTPase HflX [Elusimicrobiota bacterium]|nr:GTPase HflX [Elusimicrobiota bacterium]
MEKVFLAGVRIKQRRQVRESGLEELRRLADTSGGTAVGESVFRIDRPNSVFYIGKGQVEFLAQQAADAGAVTVIFDINLKPGQQRNLEKALSMKVIDRTRLILDIFARSAHTQDGRDQVELAQCQYLLPRLAGMWTHLERQQGGIGMRGPGEREIETDRRRIEKRISLLKKHLGDIKKRRGIQRSRRLKLNIPVIALCGYTNSGKTTLLNTLTKSDAVAKDRLFQTLQPMTRRARIFDRDVLFVDTVGFINDIPPQLINAFHSTLEEIEPASVVLVVLDGPDPDIEMHRKVVDDTLKQLAFDKIPRLYALNKCDKIYKDSQEVGFKSASPGEPEAQSRGIEISALQKVGIERLKSGIYDLIKK